jgi:hypothetical protein
MLDDPSLQGEELVRNLDEIALVNRRLGGNAIVLSGIEKLIEDKDLSAGLHIADLGCGSGDLPRLIVQWCRKRNIPVIVTAVDIHPYVLAYAKQLSADYPEIEYVAGDILAPGFWEQQFDVVTMSLFLHHFKDAQAEAILQAAHCSSRLGIVVNDLHRSAWAYYLFKLFIFVAGASKITRHDGLVSILRAFGRKELEKLVQDAKCKKYTIRWKWAFRWQLITMK